MKENALVLLDPYINELRVWASDARSTQDLRELIYELLDAVEVAGTTGVPCPLCPLSH